MSEEKEPEELEMELDEEELREAAALVRALERGAAEEPPEEALEAAALLRFAQRGGALEEERSEAILEELMSEARWPATGAAESKAVESGAPSAGALLGRLGRWLSLGLALGVALLFLWIGARPEDPHPIAELPPPPATLIAAQAAAFSGGDEERARFEEGMQGYRGELYAALEHHY